MKRYQKAAAVAAFGAAVGAGLSGCDSKGEVGTGTVNFSYGQETQSPGQISIPPNTNTAPASPSESQNVPENSTSPAQTSTSSRNVVIGRVTLGKSNFCAWTPENPEPLVSKSQVQDDGRCNSPEATVDPWNPANDPQATGIDVLPQKGSGHVISEPDGTVLTVNCVANETGEPDGSVSDANGNADALWLEVETGNGIGYAPDANEGWDATSLVGFVGWCATTPAGTPE